MINTDDQEICSIDFSFCIYGSVICGIIITFTFGLLFAVEIGYNRYVDASIILNCTIIGHDIVQMNNKYKLYYYISFRLIALL